MVSDENLRLELNNQEQEASPGSDSEKEDRTLKEKLRKIKNRIRSDSKKDNKPQAERLFTKNSEKVGYDRDHTSSSYPEISTERNLLGKHKSNVEKDRKKCLIDRQTPFEKVREVWKESECIYNEEKKKQEEISDKRTGKNYKLKSITYDPNWHPQTPPLIVNGLYKTYCCCDTRRTCASNRCLKCCEPTRSKEQISSSLKAKKSTYKPIPVSSKPSCTCWQSRVPTGFQSTVSRTPSFKKVPKCHEDVTVSHRIRDAVCEYNKATWVSRNMPENEKCVCCCVSSTTDAVPLRCPSSESCCVDESDYWLYKKTGMFPPGFYPIPRRGWLLPRLCCCRESSSVHDNTGPMIKVYSPHFRHYHSQCLHNNLYWYRRMCENIPHPKSELDAVFEAMRERQLLQNNNPYWELCTKRCEPVEKTNQVTRKYEQNRKPNSPMHKSGPSCISRYLRQEIASDEESSSES